MKKKIEANREFGFETKCLHSGQIPDAATGSRAVPIYQTSSYVFDDADHAASLFNLQTFGNVYARISNPTTSVFEERVASIENGRAAVALSSGMAAITVTLTAICAMGDHIVASKALYGGTHSLLTVNLKKFGIDTTLVDPDSSESFRKAVQPNTKAIFIETIGNPAINIIDIEKVVKVANDVGVPLIVDNTFPTPFLCKPLEWGADIVVHSATKFIGGHGTTLGGVVVESGRFPWDNGKFPGMTEPSPGYHNIKFFETFGDFAFSMKIRMEQLRVLGPSLSPFNSFLLLQGLETLPVRMERHCENAMRIAQFLQQHSKVQWVSYPGLPSDKYHQLAKRYLPNGAGSILSFGIRGGVEAGKRFIENLTFLSHLANVGDAKTLVVHPASTTHRQMNHEQQIEAGVLPELVRISVGLETLDDIIWDIDQSIARSSE